MTTLLYILVRILAFPFILSVILIKTNIYSIYHSILFLLFGGEWISYAPEDKATINQIYEELKELRKPETEK